MAKRKSKYMEVGKYLVADPEVYHGELTFKGTRVPVKTVLTYIAKGMNVDEAAKEWPDVSREAILEALALAVKALTKQHGEAA